MNFLIKKEFIIFALTSLGGLFFDFLTYHIIFLNTSKIFLSNIVGSFIAVTFVFFASRYLLIDKPTNSFKAFFFWIFLMCISTLFFSSLLRLLYTYYNNHLLIKLFVTPFSFAFNFGCWHLIKKFFLIPPFK